MAEGYHGEGSIEPMVDHGREETSAMLADRKYLHRQFVTNPRLRMMGLDWFIRDRD